MLKRYFRIIESLDGSVDDIIIIDDNADDCGIIVQTINDQTGQTVVSFVTLSKQQHDYTTHRVYTFESGMCRVFCNFE